MILVSIVPIKKSGNLFYDPHINVPLQKKFGNLFYDPRIFAHRKKVWKII